MTKIRSLQCAAVVTGLAVLKAFNLFAVEKYPPLPETVTSFGAVTSGDWLYAFGGHKGERHEYFVEMVSGQFQRLNLKKGDAWESLPSAKPGQGQPLVAHDGFIYRIGGMAARNTADEKQDLYSMSLVQRFDPKKAHWEDVASLPEVRSSHDAVVLGDKLYVAGGWQLAGGTNKPAWPANALVLDLAKSGATWQEFPQPFQRRALAGGSPTQRRQHNMPVSSMKELLEAGVHFGHHTRKWNPKMKTYIYGARNDIHIIDLHKTRKKLEEAYEQVRLMAFNAEDSKGRVAPREDTRRGRHMWPGSHRYAPRSWPCRYLDLHYTEG